MDLENTNEMSDLSVNSDEILDKDFDTESDLSLDRNLNKETDKISDRNQNKYSDENLDAYLNGRNRFTDWILNKLKINAVFLKDFRIISRTKKTLALVMIVNALLAFAALVSFIAFESDGNKFEAMDYYETYKAGELLLKVLMSIEISLVAIIIPGTTSSAITNERERQTLETLLCTKMSRFGVVSGKLLSSVIYTLLIFLTSIPTLCTLSAYYSIKPIDMLNMLIIYVIVGISLGSIGIFSSSVCRTTTAASIMTYVMAIITCLNYFIITNIGNVFYKGIEINNNLVKMDADMLEIWLLLLLLSPIYLVMTSIYDYNLNDIVNNLFEYDAFNNKWMEFVSDYSMLLTIVLQLGIAALLLWISSKRINTVKRVKKQTSMDTLVEQEQ